MTMTRYIRAGASAFAVAALSVMALAATMGSAAATEGSASAQGPLHGCPAGAVCTYTDQGWTTNTPDHSFWSYGAHDLPEDLGYKWVVNNQTGGATVTPCWNLGGTSCGYPLHPGEADRLDLSAIESIVLKAA